MTALQFQPPSDTFLVVVGIPVALALAGGFAWLCHWWWAAVCRQYERVRSARAGGAR